MPVYSYKEERETYTKKKTLVMWKINFNRDSIDFFFKSTSYSLNHIFLLATGLSDNFFIILLCNKILPLYYS